MGTSIVSTQTARGVFYLLIMAAFSIHAFSYPMAMVLSTLTSAPWLQTSNPDVFAVGDVAAFPLKLTGAVTRQEHVTNCRWEESQRLWRCHSCADQRLS